MTTHRRQMLCAHPDCKTAVKQDTTAGVCAKHMHQEACRCSACGGQNTVKRYKTPGLSVPPWEQLNP